MKFKNELTRPKHFDMSTNVFAVLGTQRPNHWPDHLGAAGSGDGTAKSDVHVNADRWNGHGWKADLGHFNECDQSFGKTNRLFNEPTSEKQQRFARERRRRIELSLLKKMVDVAPGCNQLVSISDRQKTLLRSKVQTHVAKPMFNHRGVST